MYYQNLLQVGLFLKLVYILASPTSSPDDSQSSSSVGSSSRPSITLQANSQSTPESPIDSSIRADDRHGVSNTFDIALHDPSVTFSTAGEKIQVSCPAALAWNQRYAVNSTEPIDPDEAEERWIVSYLQAHPDQTLWELFTHTLYDDVHKWVTGSNPVESGADWVVHFVADVVQNFILMMWAAFKWVVKFPFHPRKEWKQVEGFGLELWDGSKLAGSLFLDNSIDGLKTIVGGLMLHLLLHTAEFTAESILLVGAGFMVIHGLIHAMQAVAGTLPPIIGNSVMSVLIFIHILDDPLLILTPILTNTAQSVQAIGHADSSIGETEGDGGFTSDDGSSSITLPGNYTLPAASTCALNFPDPGAPPLKYGNLCHASNSTDVRLIVFGTRKTSIQMTREERLDAYRHVRKFWCCYGQGAEVKLPEGVLDDIPGRQIWEGKSYWRSIDDCGELPGSQKPSPVPSRLTLGL
ncbi:hypothetical protein CROQUDRAFT_664994 [Cronartium quercuum f. sp. fusiforme G11]|uniref:Uncharacterized protein n=1 Tax=Cronartium quercuum f. sp. fusiforme G11 TaxID=708437 RepID=A0A9P6N7S6_9BASI|nr:hypothetical protein CROQUDRAFT_664994 [Cronartium quercuum f. sp. fusiforme G11]